MKAITHKYEKTYILHDEECAKEVTPEYFETAYWSKNGSVSAVGLGRGSAWFVSADALSLVLRHYKRGGMIASISSDRYFWTGLERTRAWREWNLLAYIQQQGLPGPQPFAARVVRHGLTYTADILTHRIENSISLSSYLAENKLSDEGWHLIGNCIHQFHKAHIYHADLNAHNVLLNQDGRVFVIDFDKGRIDCGESWQLKNLQRLKRSLDKLKKQISNYNFHEENWKYLEEGYKQ